MPLLELRILEIHSFPHFSLTRLDILSWNFGYDLVLLFFRSSSSVVNLLQFFLELCPFRNVEYLKYRFPHFSLTCFDILSWNFAFSHCFTVLQIKFECWFASIFVVVIPLLELRILEIRSFPDFSLTCFDISGWNFTYEFVLLYYRSSASVVNFRQFLMELYPFWNLEYWKFTVFCTFLLHALTYKAEILHMTLFYCTTD